LQKKGYEVTVLERDDSVGGIAKTYEINGKSYDMSTMFVPGGSLACDDTSNDDEKCIQGTLKEMIDVSKEEIVPAVDFYSLNSDTLVYDLIPELLQKYTPSVIVQQLLTGLGLTLKILQCTATGDFTLHLECADATMPLPEWGDKYGVPAYAESCTFTFDGLGAGPSPFLSTYRSTVSSFASVDIAEILRNLGVNPATLEADGTVVPDNIKSLLTKPRWFSFKNGYETFWNSLVTEADIDVRLSHEVLSLEQNPVNGAWKVKTNGTTFEFDHIIVTTPPRYAKDFLPAGPLADRMAEGVFQGPTNVVFLATGDDSAFPLASEEDTYSFWPSGKTHKCC